MCYNMWYIYICDSVTVKSIVEDFRDIDTDVTWHSFSFKIDELIEEHGHKVYIYCHIIAISTPLNLLGPELGDVQ
jgi:hypothetical protein